jgi:CHAT domain-containing protein
MLLAPAAALIRNKRLLIVGDGILPWLPFAALTEPGTDESSGAPPALLVVNHEIVTAPSASVVGLLRKETLGRRPAAGAVLVLADPVFSAADPRVQPQKNPVRATLGESGFPRLRFSRDEADEIARVTPSRTVEALDFAASRDTVERDLERYRVVHFATHSVIDNRRPDLSGVVLSLVDRSGRQRNGYLRLYDIYNLRLAADLVVLSACQTALGQEVRGEGLMSLTRGFFYAGAPRVVATLWNIDDRSTVTMMKRFYELMMGRGEQPAAALRQAQLAMIAEKRWGAPYYWAAFTLQGEWR